MPKPEPLVLSTTDMLLLQGALAHTFGLEYSEKHSRIMANDEFSTSAAALWNRLEVMRKEYLNAAV